MNDLISRQAAIDNICDDWCGCKNSQCPHPFKPEEDDYYWCDGCGSVERIKNLPPAQTDLSEFADNLWRKAYERGKKNARAEIVHCKDCIHRGVVNECPFAKYAVFKNDFYSTSVTYSYTMPDSPTRVEVFCPVPDDGYCYKGDRKDDEQND